MENILKKIIATKQIEVALSRTLRPFAELQAAAESSTRKTVSFRQALLDSPTGIIAEFKRRSPSKGFIHEGADVAAVVPGYAAAGAAAVSVLTDRDYFGGSLDDLSRARTLVDIPLLRKDFIVNPYQICEARLCGADVILLIAAALTPTQTKTLAEFAHRLGLEVLLEIHNEDELGHICAEVDVVGVNNRNLTTFVTDVQTSFDLSERIPSEFVRISESGISSASTVKELRGAGFRGFLMGENFMKQTDPAAGLERFIAEL